jgi:outer membrane biosynthesis protein TonB
MKYTFMGLALALVIIALIPKAKPKPDELIPEQFTKIVMQPRTQKTAASKSNTGATAAVTQAFRAKALQNSMSGLLKGGMTKLLAQSDIVGGHTSNANVKSLFNGKSQALIQTSPNVGSINSRNIQIGGMGAGGAGAKVGYGKGERASVNGQGSALVSLDIPGSSVEEGLTKDEVGAVIHQHMSEIRYCYESAMLRTPDLEGKLIVDFTIGANGTVKSTAAKSSTLADPRLDDCILRRLATWKFPQPKGGIDVAVMYPFIFKTLGK